MKPVARRKALLLALAAAAIVAGVIVAVTSGGGHHAHKRAQQGAAAPPGELALAAAYLGISRSDLRRRLRGQTLAEVVAATPGHSVAGLEQAVLAAHRRLWQKQGVSPSEQAARAKRLRERLSKGLQRRRRVMTEITLAASYLGLAEDQVRAKMLAGDSLAQIAKATPGKSRTGLIAAIVAERRKLYEQALANRKISSKAEQKALAQLASRVQRQVDRSLVHR